jgi:hypothetical protein
MTLARRWNGNHFDRHGKTGTQSFHSLTVATADDIVKGFLGAENGHSPRSSGNIGGPAALPSGHEVPCLDREHLAKPNLDERKGPDGVHQGRTFEVMTITLHQMFRFFSRVRNFFKRVVTRPDHINSALIDFLRRKRLGFLTFAMTAGEGIAGSHFQEVTQETTTRHLGAGAKRGPEQ